MKTTLVPLIGDLNENLYQLGLKEKEAFTRLEERVLRLLSTNVFLRHGQDLLSRARTLLKKKTPGLFDACVGSYAQGLGIDPQRYLSFLSLFDIAAHYGHVYPELKGILPGCTSAFRKTHDGLTHSRIFDFPLIGIFEAAPRLYYWQIEGRPSLLTYSCEGLAPLFFQAVHEAGISLALHHKPGIHYHRDGSSIFEITFETLFETSRLPDFKKALRKRSSITKWCFLLMNNSGEVQVMDIEGPAINLETYDLNESSPLIFTNIPLQNDLMGFDSYLKFSANRQNWVKEKLKGNSTRHMLDLMTDVEDQKSRKWLHPCATLSTVGAWHVNLTAGSVDIKEGEGALVAGDAIVRFSLANRHEVQTLKESSPPSNFEKAWKRASLAQSFFDQGEYDKAYHELQMAHALLPAGIWKDILEFYLIAWDFKFVTNSRELALIYKRLKKLKIPEVMKDQWLLLCMRFEKKLGLVLTVKVNDLGENMRALFEQEQAAPKAVFLAWMKLLYPRLEVLDVFSPHYK